MMIDRMLIPTHLAVQITQRAVEGAGPLPRTRTRAHTSGAQRARRGA